MKVSSGYWWSLTLLLALCGALSEPALANTLCVSSPAAPGCYSTIQAAVNHASPGDTITVAPGTYSEQVTIGIRLSLLGAGASRTTIDATGLAHGVFVDGFDNPGLGNVNVAGFTVENAQFEGILVVSAIDVTIRDNHVINNDKSPGLQFTGAPTGCPDQPGNGEYENDETGDCGGAIHLVGTARSILSGNLVTGNADGLLISDETAESHNNLVINNVFKNNPLECGIVLASHPPMGAGPAFTTAHFGVDHNTVADNISAGNGVQIGGSGIGLFADGFGPGMVARNVIIGNQLTGNGIGGVNLHTHVGPGPAFGGPYPADNMDGNMIIGNVISGNLADVFDTATPGHVGININSGEGGSPVRGMTISQNVIRDEDVDIAINTPAEVDIHLNNLLGGRIAIADVCSLDYTSNGDASFIPSFCTGVIDATENYFGCPAGANASGCSSTSGASVIATPWLDHPLVPAGNSNNN